MILLRKICLQLLAEQGKSFNWESQNCEKCQRRMWSHGFVSRYFDGFLKEIFLKRFRCASCRAVSTVRPNDYWPRIRSPITKIYESLRARFISGSWPPGSPRQRQGHWLRRFIRKAQMDFSQESDLAQLLSNLYRKEIPFFT